jgi:type II secretory pathway component PulK
MLNSSTRFASRGSALLVVLWVLALLSFLIVTSMMIAMKGVESVSSHRLVFRARQLAESGLAVGAHPSVKPNDPLLHKQFSSLESYDVNVTTEESRLNINALLTDDRRGILERLFSSWGLDPVEAQSVVDCLMDWVDADDVKRLKGAEKEDYARDGFPDRPYNRPFRTLDEVALVKGMDHVIALNPGWKEWFTLWGSGMVDINEASPEVIAAVTGATLQAARNLVAQRNGPDGIPHTKDDQPIEDVNLAIQILGLPPGTNAPYTSLLVPHGSVARIDSRGRAGSYVRHISAVMQKGAGLSQILEWRESAEE